MSQVVESELNIPELVRRFRDGCNDAAQILQQLVQIRILGIVRQRLHPTLRPRFDSQDFLQTVWLALYSSRCSGIESCTTLEQLLSYVGGVARNQVSLEHRRRWHHRKSTAAVEERMRTSIEISADRRRSRQPSPSEVMTAQDLASRLEEAAPEHHREAVREMCRGTTHAEISSKLGVSERTLSRLLKRLEERFS